MSAEQEISSDSSSILLPIRRCLESFSKVPLIFRDSLIGFEQPTTHSEISQQQLQHRLRVFVCDGGAAVGGGGAVEVEEEV